MYKDNLEEFIKGNRADFDTKVPSLKVWAEIDKQLEQKHSKRRRLFVMVRAAAAAVVLLFSGAMAGSYYMAEQEQTAAVEIEALAPEYAEMVQHYSSEFNSKYQQLASLNATETVSDDLEQVDRIMEELKTELQNAPKGSEEQIISSLIISYQTKVDILERVLERIHKSNRKLLNPEDNEISI